MDKAIIKAISAIIPTANRASVLKATFASLGKQEVQPAEVIVIDASEDDSTWQVCEDVCAGLQSVIKYIKTTQKGAAAQRNQGTSLAAHPFILFCDDDIVLEPGCLQQLWDGINSSDDIGGVNAMITNQQYHTPGKLTRLMYRIMHGQKLSTYAGKCIGPAWNLLPEDDNSLPELVNVEWLNTTCTLYRKIALPDPVFSPNFTGYSLMEDLALSLIVAKEYKLYNARTARIFHDSQPGSHKKNAFNIARMELINRHYIMRYVLGRNDISMYCRLMLLQLFGVFASLTTWEGWQNLGAAVAGKISAIFIILFDKRLSASQ